MATELQPQNRSVLAGGNLLQIKAIDNLMRSKWFPGIIQWPTLLVFMVIMFQLLLGPESAHDNLGTALTWVLWWPLIPIIFLFLGRFWCAICPFATINDLVQKLVGNNRPVPRFLKKYGIWIIDAFFILSLGDWASQQNQSTDYTDAINNLRNLWINDHEGWLSSQS